MLDEWVALCASWLSRRDWFAKATHVKAIYWADDGEELSQHVGHAIQLLQRAGYAGTWGIESCPQEVDEYEGVKLSKALIEKYVKA